MKEESFSSFNEEPFDSSVIPREGEHVRLKSQLTKAEVRALQEFQQSFVHEGVIYNTQAIDDCSESLEKFKNDKKVSRERRQMIWEEHLSIKMNTEIARVLSNQKKKLAQEITFLMELKNDKDKWNMAIDLNFSEYLNATLLSASETIKQEYFASIHSTSGLTPLHCACKTNNADNVEFLLNMGANLKVLDQSGNTLFHLVVEYGYIDLFRKLLGHFKSIQDQKILSQCNHHGQSLLHLAAKKGRTEILMLLLEEFPDIVDEILNLETQEEKNTALHLAALYGHVECIRLLLQTPGLKGCVRNINGSIALHLAMKQTFHIDALMQVFLDFVPPDEKDTFDLIDEANGLNCLHLAILKSIRQFAIELIQQHKVQVNIPTSEGLSPLHLAVIVQSQEIVDALIQNGAIVDMVNNYGQTPLLQACLGGNLEIIRLLLKAGANPGHQNHQAHSVLHYLAAYCYDATLVEEIIERGADINATSIKLNTPLHFAGMNGNHVAAKVLLDHGANRNAINEDKKSVLFLAKKWK
jgi:ankyrin repeat protein